MPPNHRSLEDQSLIQLLKKLTASQCWGVGVIIFGVVSGTFTLGYKLSDYSRSIELDKLKIEYADIEKKNADLESQLKTSKIRQAFVTDYERYLLADLKAKQLPSVESNEEAQRAKKILADQVYVWWKQQRESTGSGRQWIDKQFQTGDSRLAFLNGDSVESIWVIPPEIKYEVLSRP